MKKTIVRQKFNVHPTERRAPVSHAFLLFRKVKRNARAVLVFRNGCPGSWYDNIRVRPLTVQRRFHYRGEKETRKRKKHFLLRSESDVKHFLLRSKKRKPKTKANNRKGGRSKYGDLVPKVQHDMQPKVLQSSRHHVSGQVRLPDFFFSRTALPHIQRT